MPCPIPPSRSPQPLQAAISTPNSADRPPANLQSTRIRARTVASVTSSPPSPILAPSIGGFGFSRQWYAIVAYGTFLVCLVGNARLWLVEPWFRYHTFMSRPRKRRRQPDQSSVGQSPTVSTYQTRIAVYEGLDRAEGDAALAAYAELYGQVERKLFAEVAAGRSAASLKSDYIREHGIPARLFNAVRVSLEGKVSAVRAAQRLRVDSLERRIAQGERQVAKAEEQGRWQQVHEKRRRLANLRSRLAGLETDIGAGRVRLCFGSKRLWRKRDHLEANGYASHEEWLQDWRDARSNEFFVLGSRDETSGCQLCVASIADDGSLTLRLRMPDCLAEQHGKYLVIRGCAVCLRPRAGANGLAQQCRLRRIPARAWREGGARHRHLARPSATGSSGTARDGGCL